MTAAIAAGRVLVVGPPNAGKSTLFKRLTGAAADTGNYAGTTVHVETSTLRSVDVDLPILDLPGTSSLVAHAADEEVTLRALLDGAVSEHLALVLLVLDAPRLSRSLYLGVQVAELGLPTVVAVNLMDEAREAGRPPNADALREFFGTEVVLVSARQGEGLDALRSTLDRALRDPEAFIPKVDVGVPEATARDVDTLRAQMPAWARFPDSPARERAVARWALLSAGGAHEAGRDLPWSLIESLHKAATEQGRDLDAELVGSRYAFIDARLPTLFTSMQVDDRIRRRTDAIDGVLLHPVFGTVAFLTTMSLVFLALFSWSDPFIGLIEGLFGWLGDQTHAAFAGLIGGATGSTDSLVILRDFVTQGLINGVGSVLVFVPQIAVLFLLLALLEDCGYLARAAALMDRILRLAGLPGRAFVPLLSGYACAVPAILSTRSIPRFRDRLLTMLVVPLTSCSARLPVYTLVVGALFPPTVVGWSLPMRPVALLVMYLFSTLITLLAAVVLGKLVVPGDAIPTVLEMPPYRIPDARNVLRMVVSRVGDFLREAGRTILVATVVLWALLSFPRYTPEQVLSAEVLASAKATGADLDALAAPVALERSYAGRIGQAIEPVIRPLGFDWKIGVGLIGAFAAREVFVATLGVVYGIEDADESNTGLRERLRTERRADGTAQWTPRTGMSVMVFFALAMQCMSTLAVLRKETEGWKWPVFVTVYMSGLAWVLSLLTYQGLGLLGVP
jgi:ferrous iron transport protein B